MKNKLLNNLSVRTADTQPNRILTVVLAVTIPVLCGIGSVSCKDAQRATETHSSTDTVISAQSSTENVPADTDQGNTHTQNLSAATRALFRKLDKQPIEQRVHIAPLKGGSVVLLIYDALNAQHMSVYGYERKTTPFMEQIANQGLILTNHVSNSTWTRPSFTTIVTGVPKSIHGVEAVGGWRLEPHIHTLAERFRAAGYRTAGFTGNPLVRKSWGFDQGYQLYEGPTTRGLKAFPNDSIWVNAATKWLDKIDPEKPFFLMMFLTSSHPPYRPPAQPRTFLSQVPKGEIIEHPFREYKTPLSADDNLRIQAAYDDEIAYMDAQVNRLFDHLKKIGRMDNTVVAMTADHGEMMGEHSCYLHAYHMWEQNTRVPFILSAPNLPLKNAMDDRPFTHVDIAPTLLDLVGISFGNELPGISMVDALENPSINQTRMRYTQVNAHGVRRQMMRVGNWKLIHHNKVEDSTEEELDRLHPSVHQPNPRDLPSLAWDGERWELFNLNRDPGETENLYGTTTGETIIKSLKPALDKKRRNARVAKPDNMKLAPELLEALKKSGYIR
ncbi:MAG: sulfatase [Deltaproteobacteria bacterium]|nr:sulfatase [Deltaproteobacteria bacterium]MBN2671283.1 sulfatase [Deltaproteobacteria bacterium]